MTYIRPNFNFTYNGKHLCLNDASDWAFFANKLYNGTYDNILTNINGQDDWEDSVFPWEKEEKKRNPLSRKGRNRKAKQSGKRNADKAKRLHKADRYHGKTVPQSDKKYWDEQSGTFYRWDKKRKTFDSYKKPVVHRNRKTFRDRLNAVMDAKEKEYAHFFTGVGELLEDIKYLEDRIRIYEEDIEDLEYEKAFGYLTEEGEKFLEDYKKELEDLRKYKEYKEILLRTI